MAESVPMFADSPIPWTASATIVGGNLLEVTGAGTVGPAAVNSIKVIGTAASDAATGAVVAVHSEGIVNVVASGTITAGDWVIPAAAGQVQTIAAVTDFRQGVGVARTGATVGVTFPVLLRGF